MNKRIVPIALFPLLISAFALTSCGPDAAPSVSGDKVLIHILHQQDYMDEELIKDFEKRYPECQVVFDKSDTNETVYSELQTGKAQYDLVTVSEYMIQRMAAEGLVQKIDLPENKELLKNYHANISPWMKQKGETAPKGKLDTIKVISYDENKTELGTLGDYTVGYMWGTLGTLVNPYYKEYEKRGMTRDQILEDLKGLDGWSTFWNPEYKGTHSIKESMRDTYAMGILEVYKDEFIDPSISYEAKQTRFNDHSKEAISKVKDALIDLKGNIFGFEVDSGKNDIVTGKIGMNLAWSGDAGFSIYQGEYDGNDNEKPEEKKTLLYYNIPTSGANIWFDGFAMPKTCKPGTPQYEYTLKFIDFMCEQESVVRNMEYTGFTSFMSGPETGKNKIEDYVLDMYDMTNEDGSIPEGYIQYDISYFFNDEEMILNVDPHSFEGRGIVAAYPEADDIGHLYIMEDYGEDNGKIVQMWEDIKVNPLPTWIIVTLITFVVLALGYLASYNLIKRYKVKKRKSLRK